MTVVCDAGALIAADRSDRTEWADHRVRLELGVIPVTTAPVVAHVRRSGRQAQLRRFLRGCEVVPFLEGDAHAVGGPRGRVRLGGRRGRPRRRRRPPARLRGADLRRGDLRPIAEALPAAVPVVRLRAEPRLSTYRLGVRPA